MLQRLLTRWPWRSVAAIAAVCFVAGLAAHRAPPAKVTEVAAQTASTSSSAASATKEAKGAERAGERVRVVKPCPVCPGAPGDTQIVEIERYVERGPSTRETAAAEAGTRAESAKLNLQVLQAPPASWAVSVGLQLRPERTPVLGLSHRLVGPFWVEAWISPRLALAAPAAAGAQLRLEF